MRAGPIIRLFQALLLVALLLASGCALPWTTTGASHPIPSPTPESALARRTVYWSQGNYLWAFRASDGRVRWKVGGWSGSLPKSGEPYTSGPGLPTLIDGTIYATAIDDGYATPELYAIDSRSGAIRWHTVLLDCLQYAAPLVQNGVIYLTTTGHRSGAFPCERNGYVLALRASDGKVLWRAALEPVISDAPVITDDYPAHLTATFINAFRASDGALLWRQRLNLGIGNLSLVGDAGTVVVGAGTEDASHPQWIVEAIQAADGRQLWITAINGWFDPLAGALIANGTIYLDAGDGITALRASDGKVIWSSLDGARGFSSPLLLDGRLYVGAGTELLTLDASSGALLRAYAVFDPPIDPEYVWYGWSRPAITNGTIYFSASYGSILCCPPETAAYCMRLICSRDAYSGAAWRDPVTPRALLLSAIDLYPR
jgi:outer membrane protein assembly factor BamB